MAEEMVDPPEIPPDPKIGIPNETPNTEKVLMFQRYLIAICNANAGGFDHMTVEQLLDVVAVIPKSFHSFQIWEQSRKRMDIV